MNLDFMQTPEFKAARDLFIAKYNDQGRSYCTCVGFFDKNSGWVEDRNPQCHIGPHSPGTSEDGGYYDEDDEWVDDEDAGRVSAPLVIFSGFQEYNNTTDEKPDLFEFWFNYQKNHPIIGAGVLNEDWKDAYDNGWMFRTDLNYNTVCCSVFFTRWPSEFSGACRAMKLLVEAGCQPDMAFLVSTVMTSDDKGNLIEQVQNSHMPCQSHLYGDFPYNFLSHKDIGKDKGTYRSKHTYTSINGVFCSTPQYHYGGIKDITKGDGAKIVRALRSVNSTAWVQGADIFYTKEQHEKEMSRKGVSLMIQTAQLPDAVKALNAVREEILNG